MFKSRRSQIAQHLRGVLIDQLSNGLQLDDEFVCDQQIRGKVTETRAVFVEHCERVLLTDVQANLTEAIGQGVLIDFLSMSVP